MRENILQLVVDARRGGVGVGRCKVVEHLGRTKLHVALGRLNVASCVFVPSRSGQQHISLVTYSRYPTHVRARCAFTSLRTHNKQLATHTPYTDTTPNVSAAACGGGNKTGTKRISITLRERKETLPPFLLPVPDCRCGVPATLNSRVLENGTVEYLFHCDRARGACGFTLFKGPSR